MKLNYNIARLQYKQPSFSGFLDADEVAYGVHLILKRVLFLSAVKRRPDVLREGKNDTRKLLVPLADQFHADRFEGVKKVMRIDLIAQGGQL